MALIGKGKASDTGLDWTRTAATIKGSNWTNPNGQDGAPYDADVHPSLATGNMNGTGIYQGFYDFAYGGLSRGCGPGVGGGDGAQRHRAMAV